MVLNRETRQAWLGYAVALGLVALAAGGRAAFLGILGTRLTYITFYPAVVLAALYGRLGGGLVATVLSGFLASVFWIEPVGRFFIRDEADWLGMAIFLMSGAMISGTAEAMHRAQARANNAEAEARLAAERKKAGVELQRFASLADNSPEFIGMCDLNFMPFYVNQAGMGMVGLDSLEQMRRTPVQEFFFPEDQPFIIETFFPRVLREGRAEVEIRFRHFQTGEALWMLYNVFYIKDATGQPAGLATVSRNITERKRAEGALRESQERYHTLFNTLIEGFCIIEALFDADDRCVDYRFLEVNPAFEKQTGLHDAPGKLMRDLAPDHEAHWFEIYGRVARTGEPARFENEAKALSRWYEVFAYRVGEQESRKVAILFNDISERKRAEKALSESEATNRALLETASQAILAVNVDGATVLANRMTEAMFGYERDELLGRPLEMLVPQRLRERHVEHRAGFRSNPKTRPMGTGLELQGLRKDGSEFPIEVSLSNVETSRGPLAVAFVTDITLRKKGEAALQNSERELRALARSLLTAQEDERRRIARDLHDDVTQRLAFLSIEVGKSAAAVDTSAEEARTRLRSLQNQVIQISHEVRRLSHGLHSSVIEDFGLSIALEEFCDEFGGAHGISVQFDASIDDSVLTREAASCLYRIAQECVHNAAKHARPSEVLVTLRAAGGKMQLQVTDNGTGFSTEHRSTRTGLGIASMKERVRMLNGALNFDSRPGQGTVVTVSVPI